MPRVDKIVGPGNIYVAAAKRLVFGEVDIDSIAGPSEILVVADESADAVLIAADLLSPAEHVAVHTVDARALANRILRAGAIFVGAMTPEAAGDYLAGPKNAVGERS